jgi:retron-type reverse transcriptase
LATHGYKVSSLGNLRAAVATVKANRGSPGFDHVTIEMFATGFADNLDRLAESLRSGTYRPQAIHRVWILKPGTNEKRVPGIPTVRDRVVQASLRNVLEPIFERDFAAHSYGFRPGRGCKDALRQEDTLLRRSYTFVVDAAAPGGFDFLGHHFERGKHRPRSKNLRKFKDSIRAKTRRRPERMRHRFYVVERLVAQNLLLTLGVVNRGGGHCGFTG